MTKPVIFWWQTPDRRTWRAAVGVLVLTVSKTSTGQWVGTMEGPEVSKRSPGLPARLTAQRWAENRVAGAA